MSELPSGWVDTTLEKVIDKIVGGGTPSKINASFFQGSIPFMTVKDMKSRFPTDTIDHISDDAISSSATTLVPKDSLIVATRMSLGKIVRPQFDTAINQDLKALLLSNEIDKTYIEFFWRSKSGQIENLGTGTTVKGIRLEDIRSLNIPLAPLPEQKRIADKLDTLLARVDACRERLNRVPLILKRFRQSVLSAAIYGRLTADWRDTEGNSQGNAQAEVDRKESLRAGKLRVRVPSTKLAADFLFDIPESWAWISNHRLAEDSPTSICAGPFGTIFKAKDFREAGVPIIFLRHVGEGEYLTRKPGFMDEKIWKEHHQPYSVFGGELLVTKLGDPPGTACIYPKGIGTAMVTPDVMKMNVDADVAHPVYLMHFFNSPLSKKIVSELAFGVTRLRIDLSMFKTFPIPLPPIEEQHEIVRRVETLFAFADRLEARLATARAVTDRLTPALLAKAFRGELVPQDPNDEPAAELLKRLADARTATSDKPRRGRAAKFEK